MADEELYNIYTAVIQADIPPVTGSTKVWYHLQNDRWIQYFNEYSI